MTLLYSLLLLLLLYGVAAMFYFVYYTPGTYTLYDTPMSRILFPWAAHPLFPTWGFGSSGMLKASPTKYGAGDFWPTTQTFTPTDSRGADPMGGMRPTKLHADAVELRDGYDPLPSLTHGEIYDHSRIPKKTIAEIGWWGDA